MANQNERQGNRANHTTTAKSAALQGKKLSMDFARIVKTIDLSGVDDNTIEEMNKASMNGVKNDTKIKEFYANKSTYYKKLAPKQGVW